MFTFLISDLGRLTASLLVSLLLGLLSAVLTWLRDLNRSARRVKALDEAKKRMDFWEQAKRIAWADASPVGEQVKKAAEIDYVKCLNLVTTALSEWPRTGRWKRQEYLGYLGGVPRFRRFFLLYRQMNYSNVLFRALFFMALSAWLFVVLQFLFYSNQYPSIARDHSMHVLLEKVSVTLLSMAAGMRFVVWQDERIAVSDGAWNEKMSHKKDSRVTWEA